MKRRVALLIVLTLCLSLFAACGNGAGSTVSPPASGSQSPSASPSASAPPPDSPPPSQGGVSPQPSESQPPPPVEKPPGQVWLLLPTVAPAGMVMIAEGIGEVVSARGYTWEMKDCQANDSIYISNIENAITAGDVDILVIAAWSVAAVKDAVHEAMDAGITVVMFGTNPAVETAFNPEPYEIHGVLTTSHALVGYYAVRAAEEWASQNSANLPKRDGKVPVAVTTLYTNEDGAKRSNAILGEITAGGVLTTIADKQIYGQDAQTEGYSWAETLVSANTDLRMFICYQYDSGYGVISYLDQYCEENNIDKTEFCVLFCYEDRESPVLLEQAREDPSSTVFKGYVTYGAAPPITGNTIGNIALGSIDGTYPFGYLHMDIVNAHTSYGYAFRWEQGMDNPAIKYETLD